VGEPRTEACDHDWTVGADGRSNSSAAFVALRDAVERIIRDDSHTLISGRAGSTAGLIMAQLAHVHGLRPADPPSGEAALVPARGHAERRAGPMPMTVSDVIAARVRAFRKLRQLSVEQLAERCKALGAPELTPASLTNVERPAADGNRTRPRRAVQVPELLVLAQALHVPALALILPDAGETVEILPGRAVTPWEAREWLIGSAPLPADDWPDAPSVLERDEGGQSG
jgi:transcriptional regulator with XRE-family HTH domain